MKRRNLVAAVGLLTFALLLCVVLVEVVLRGYAAWADSGLADALRVDPYAVLVEPHGEAGFRPRPERTFEYYTGMKATTNAQGFRGPAVAVPKAPGTFRIVLLGGSTTFGWGVAEGETIDSYMRQMLAERYVDRAIEVVNLAFDGYDSYQLLERLRSDGLRLEPDVVIVNTGVNDVRNAWFRDIEDGDRRTMLYLATIDQLRIEQARGGPTLWTRAKHWFYLARLPGWLRQRLRLAAVRSYVADRPPPTYYWEAVDYFERNLRRLVELATDSARAKVMFSTPPSSLRIRDDGPAIVSYRLPDAEETQVYRDSLSLRMQAVASESAVSGLPVAFVPHENVTRALFLDDAHLTPAGNRRVAGDFVAALGPWIEEGVRRHP